ncbi:MAG: PAS domain-containing protein [Pseudomonadota bacterium]
MGGGLRFLGQQVLGEQGHSPVDLEQTFAQVNMGILVIDKEFTIVLCNHFMSDHIHKSADQLIGSTLFDSYPELPENWLKQRFHNIFLLKNSSFISWEQRSCLFNFPSSRPVTGSNEKMIQNCSLFPIMDAEHEVTHICITVNDATATAMNHIQLKKTSIKLTQEKKAQQILIEKLEETKKPVATVGKNGLYRPISRRSCP